MASRYMLVTGPETYAETRGVLATRKLAGAESSDQFGWTLSRKAVTGDLLVVYGAVIQEFGIIGRVVSQPVRSSTDGNWWGHVEMAYCPVPLTLATAKQHPILSTWGRLRMLAGSCHPIAEPAVWKAFCDLLIAPHPDLQRIVAGWGSTAEYPDVSNDPLDDAWFESSGTRRSGTSHERELQRAVRNAYISNGWARDPVAADRLNVAVTGYVPGVGFADLVLVDLEQQSPRRVLVVEVKRDAVLGPQTEGVHQVLRYCRGLRARLPRVEVKPVLVALSFSRSVVDLASRLGVECWEFDDGDLYAVEEAA